MVLGRSSYSPNSTINRFILYGITHGTTSPNQIAAFNSTGSVELGQTVPLCWNNGTQLTGIDTGISRHAPGTLAIGNGTQGNASGTLELTHLTLVGTKNTTINSGATGADWTLTLPVDAGTGHPGYVLSTDGSGTTSWVAQSGSSGVPANTTLWTAPASLANSATNWSDCTIIVRMPGTHLLAPATSWKIRLTASAGTGIHIQAFKIFKVLSNQNSPSTAGSSVVSSTSVTVGGNMPATVISAAPFDIVTDAISLTLDPLYDYYMVLYLDTDGTYNGTLGFYRNNNTSDLLFGALGTPFSGGYVVGDHSADATLPALTSGNYAFNSGSVYAIKRVLSA
jgi:hypothetical protein